MHEHAGGEVIKERGGDGQVGVVDPIAKRARQRDEADRRGDDADDDQRTPWVVHERIDRLAEKDEQRIAGRVGVVVRRIELFHRFGEEELVILPGGNRRGNHARDQDHDGTGNFAPREVTSDEC